MDPRKEGEEVGVDANSDMMGVRTKKIEKEKPFVRGCLWGKQSSKAIFILPFCKYTQTT